MLKIKTTSSQEHHTNHTVISKKTEFNFYLGKMGENLQTTRCNLEMKNISELDKLINNVKKAIAKVNNFNLYKAQINKLEKNLVYFKNILNKLSTKNDFCVYFESTIHQKLKALLTEIKEEEEKYRFDLDTFYKKCRQEIVDTNCNNWTIDFSFSLNESFDYLNNPENANLIKKNIKLKKILMEIKKTKKKLKEKKEKFEKRKEKLLYKIEKGFKNIANSDLSNKFYEFANTSFDIQPIEEINQKFKTILKQLIGNNKKENFIITPKQLNFFLNLYHEINLWHYLEKEENRNKVYNEDLMGIALP